MKKRDLLLLLSAVLLGFLLMAFIKLTKEAGDTVIITKDDEIYGEYALSTNLQIDIDGTNQAVIEDGYVYMKSATCPDKLCVHQGKTGDSSKKIVCLPNRVTIEVTKKSEIDKVVR